MNNLFVFSVFFVFWIPNIQSEKIDLLKYYENSVNVLVSERFVETKYCASILSPTPKTLEESLNVKFITAKDNNLNLNDEHHVDSCCRSLYKCDAHKHKELNQTTELHMKHCSCVHYFQSCLYNLNTSLSNEVSFIHALNATKCYAEDYPIVKCIQFELYSESKIELLTHINEEERVKYFNRCVKYDLDKSQPRKLQTFDVPFNVHKVSTTVGKLTTNAVGVKLGSSDTMAGDKMDTEFNAMYERRTFTTTSDIVNFVIDLTKSLKKFGCSEYDNVFKGLKDAVEDKIQVKAHKNNLVHILNVIKTLTKLSCDFTSLLKRNMTSNMCAQGVNIGIISNFTINFNY